MFKLRKNIFLVGFVGSGKTTLGQLLAAMLKIDFFDTDELITQMQEMSIEEIFGVYGENFFRDKESEVLALLGQKTPGTCIVSTGGGAMLRENNWPILKKNGIAIYLEVAAEEIYNRLKETDDRPIFKPILKLPNPLGKIAELLKERKPFYAQADFTINAAGKSLQDIAAEIIAVLQVNQLL